MRLEQLEYFMDIAKTKSINISAERLYVTQPAISQAIHSLEEELDCALLIRSKKGVELTLAGQAVEKWANVILENIVQMKEEVFNIKINYDLNLEGELLIGSTPLIDQMFISKILQTFLEKYPKINIKANEIKQKEIEQALSDGIVDLVLASSVSNRPQEREEKSMKTILSEFWFVKNLCMWLHVRII